MWKIKKSKVATVLGEQLTDVEAFVARGRSKAIRTK